MFILPEVQITDGKLVTRSVSVGNQIFHKMSPEQAARQFEEAGAQLLHVVDIDAARGEESTNVDLVTKIVENASIPIQVAGGIRTLNQVNDWFAAGAARVVLGTVAITDPGLVSEASNRHPGGVIVNLATKNNYVMIDGWQTQTSFDPRDIVYDLQMMGIAGVIHFDIDRFEGEALEPLALTMELSQKISIPVFSSGTVHTLDDIARLRYLPNVNGAIVGHALITGAFTLKEALDVAAQKETSLEPETITPIVNSGVHRTARAYLAAYTQSPPMRSWNRELREAIQASNPYLEVMIPHDDIVFEDENLSPREIQTRYESVLDSADVVIAVLDGIASEAWTGFECGYSRAKGKYLIGLKGYGNDNDVQNNRFIGMCDDIVYYDANEEGRTTLDAIAQEIASRTLIQVQAASS